MKVMQVENKLLKNWMPVGGLLALCIAIMGSMMVGVVQINLGQLLAIISATNSGELYQIIYNIRIPRIVVGALTGANLALAGAVLQGVLRNPLADPGIIGISAGAGLAAISVMILLPQYMGAVPAAAFLGAIGAAALVYVLSWRQGVNPLRLVLAGVAVAAFFGGFMTVLMVFHSDKVQGTVNWMAGGFMGRSWNHVMMIMPYTIIGLIGTLFAARYLNLLSLGDEVAKSLGIPVEKVRVSLLSLAALLAASAVSVAGLLGFVGLIVPHVTRLLVGSDFERVLPVAAILGAFLVVVADTVARTIFNPIEIPVGVLMAFLGAPFFLYLLRKGGAR